MEGFQFWYKFQHMERGTTYLVLAPGYKEALAKLHVERPRMWPVKVVDITPAKAEDYAEA